MEVNYNLPPINDRGESFSEDSKPNVETYLHCFGEFLAAFEFFQKLIDLG